MLTDTISTKSHHLQQLSAFAQIGMKDYHNQHHAPRFSKVRDMVYLGLHYAEITYPQTGLQFVGSLKVFEWIGRQAYRPEIFAVWKIHLVILVAHLELAT